MTVYLPGSSAGGFIQVEWPGSYVELGKLSLTHQPTHLIKLGEGYLIMTRWSYQIALCFYQFIKEEAMRKFLTLASRMSTKLLLPTLST